MRPHPANSISRYTIYFRYPVPTSRLNDRFERADANPRLRAVGSGKRVRRAHGGYGRVRRVTPAVESKTSTGGVESKTRSDRTMTETQFGTKFRGQTGCDARTSDGLGDEFDRAVAVLTHRHRIGRNRTRTTRHSARNSGGKWERRTSVVRRRHRQRTGDAGRVSGTVRRRRRRKTEQSNAGPNPLDRSASAGEVELCWVRPRVVEKYYPRAAFPDQIEAR